MRTSQKTLEPIATIGVDLARTRSTWNGGLMVLPDISTTNHRDLIIALAIIEQNKDVIEQNRAKLRANTGKEATRTPYRL
jgi:hypothetical protein